MLDLLLAGDGEKVVLDRDFHVLLVEAARRSRCRACCSPSLRRSTCARTRGGPVAPRRRLGPGKRPFAHPEAKAPVEIGKWHGGGVSSSGGHPGSSHQKRERPYGMTADMCVHRTNVCRSALNGARHLARGNPPVLPIFSPLFTSDCRQADHLPSLTPYYWSSKHFDVPSVRF